MTRISCEIKQSIQNKRVHKCCCLFISFIFLQFLYPNTAFQDVKNTNYESGLRSESFENTSPSLLIVWQRRRQSPSDNSNSGPPSCVYPADSVGFNNASPAAPLLQTAKTQHVNYNRQIIKPPLHLFVCFYSPPCGWKPVCTFVRYRHFGCSRGSMRMQIVFTCCHKRKKDFSFDRALQFRLIPWRFLKNLKIQITFRP